MQAMTMKTMQRKAKLALVSVVAIWGLSACGTVSTPAVQAKLTGKSITVVSVVGETVELSWRGTTVFNNEKGEARVPDWGLRTRVEDRAVAMLEASRRFSTVQRAQISATRREEALKQIEDLKTGSSHILLFTPNESGDSIFETSQGFYGLGVAQRSIMGVASKSAVHASLKADLIELGTFQRTLAQSVSANAQRVPAPALLGGPRLNPEYTGPARDALRVQVDAVVTSLLTQMGLDQPVGGMATKGGEVSPAQRALEAPAPQVVAPRAATGAQPSPVRPQIDVGPGVPLDAPAK
ncbi:hypothetical protein LPB72_20490 [Hydrogenophaga crassostreae]|uniref:DUF4410 domain-containing protein n=1 Tax=Hydrogenophaga crassostreae TaxID=1763535 RepID=A0A163C678_9BURK|nr:hypothetical protein [Hydrogenophaga crassostreae]AOW14812.1 hypothetical protein LPB072_20320 [Hydrogenophaga crassostreae]OAD39641.1 hypothetical protein LPB72_20490 [Hydrogenophaga crassostreae]